MHLETWNFLTSNCLGYGVRAIKFQMATTLMKVSFYWLGIDINHWHFLRFHHQASIDWDCQFGIRLHEVPSIFSETICGEFSGEWHTV